MRNRLGGRVVPVLHDRPAARVEMDCGFPLVAVIAAQSAAKMDLKVDDVACALVKATAVDEAASVT
jgi:molybdopterin-binding protein